MYVPLLTIVRRRLAPPPVFGMSKLQAVAVAVVVATAIFASASAEAMETVPGVPELVVPPVGYNEEKDAIFFAKPELSAMNSRGKEMRGKRVNKAAIDYDGECGGHIDRPVGIRNYAPKSLRRRQNDLTNQFMRDATTYGKNVSSLPHTCYSPTSSVQPPIFSRDCSTG